MKTPIPFAIAITTVAFILSGSPLLPAADNWQTYDGVTVWTQYPNKARTFTWSGTTDADGKAQGPGTYVVYFKGKKVVTYTGTMQAGQLTGRVNAVYHQTGQTYEGEIRDNSENGFGTMKDADGTVRTGRWVDGKLVEPAAAPQASSPPAVTTEPKPVSSATDNADPPSKPAPPIRPASTAGVVALAPGIEPPHANASATEQFIYELSVITRRYIMEATYHPTPDESYKDAYWAKERATAVAKLLSSPLGAEIPDSLRKFCVEALTLDAGLQAIAQHRDQTSQRSRDEGMGLIDQMIGGLPGTMFHGSAESNSVERSAADLIFGTIARVQEAETMLGQFRNYKATLGMHRRWAALLQTLAADDPGLRPFAAEPRVSDPSWHFMHNQAGGDAFFGRSRDLSRTAHGVSFSLPKRYVGDVTQGPIRVHFNAHGVGVGYGVEFKGTKYGEVFVAHCRRGHFVVWGEGGSATWVARGMRDSELNGKISYGNTIAGNPTTYTIGLCHLATTMEEEDLDVSGDVLIYLEYQYRSEADAAQHARDVDLR